MRKEGFFLWGQQILEVESRHLEDRDVMGYDESMMFSLLRGGPWHPSKVFFIGHTTGTWPRFDCHLGLITTI